MASNLELHNKLVQLVSQERRLTIEVVRHLREAERQMLFSELGYPSLFSYCVKGLGYSEAAAYRRIEVMRTIQDEPSVERKIELGVLSRSAVSSLRAVVMPDPGTRLRALNERELSVRVKIGGAPSFRALSTKAQLALGGMTVRVANFRALGLN